MPYKTDKLPLASQFLDRRVKLLNCQQERLKKMHADGVSIHALASIFHISRRSVQFILFPERKEANLLARKQRGGHTQYYNREDWAGIMREHRKYKYKTLSVLL